MQGKQLKELFQVFLRHSCLSKQTQLSELDYRPENHHIFDEEDEEVDETVDRSVQTSPLLLRLEAARPTANQVDRTIIRSLCRTKLITLKEEKHVT